MFGKFGGDKRFLEDFKLKLLCETNKQQKSIENAFVFDLVYPMEAGLFQLSNQRRSFGGSITFKRSLLVSAVKCNP